MNSAARKLEQKRRPGQRMITCIGQAPVAILHTTYRRCK